MLRLCVDFEDSPQGLLDARLGQRGVGLSAWKTPEQVRGGDEGLHFTDVVFRTVISYPGGAMEIQGDRQCPGERSGQQTWESSTCKRKGRLQPAI